MSVLFQDGWLSNHKDKGIDKKEACNHVQMKLYFSKCVTHKHVCMCEPVGDYIGKTGKKNPTHTYCCSVTHLILYH